MTIKDTLGQRTQKLNMHDGRGETQVYGFFQGQVDSSMGFWDLVVKPGAYVGYHRHDGSAEILYVASGEAENFQKGERCTLRPGDAILVKSGQAHALRNIGDEDLRFLGFLAVPGGESAVSNLPLPEAISGWE